MPLTAQVGLSRKLTDNNYSSRGSSAALEVELDAGLLSQPEQLRQKLQHAFVLIRMALEHELGGTDPPGARGVALPGEAHPPATDRPPDHHDHHPPRPATPSQCRALCAIARQRDVELAQFLRVRFRVASQGSLSVRQASSTIDALKLPLQNAG